MSGPPGLGSLRRRSEPRGVRSTRVRRVAFCGPVPPTKTGIATYDRAVLDGLARIGFASELPMEVVWPLDDRHVSEIPSYELAVYQMGNNVEFHLDVYRMAWHVPGLVVLHDLALDDFVRGMQTENDPLGFRAVQEASEARRNLRSVEARRNEPLRTPWAAAIARRARGIVVHADFGRRYLEEMGCVTPVYVVPHPPVETPDAIAGSEARGRTLRAKIEAKGGRTLLVAPGEVNEAKRLEVVFDAVSALPRDVHLAVVGRPVSTWDIGEAADRYDLGDRLHVELDAPDVDFLGWLHAADVVIDLRFPHRGEVSGSLARAMQVGRPAIVSATGTYLDAPDGTVLTIGAGPGDPHELAERLRQLIDDPALRASMGGAAKRYMDHLRTSESTARGYAEAIRATIAIVRDPVGPAMARWARSLADIGITQREVDQGYGLRYARALESFKGTS
jgi:glycosyltransferase involved in cell wall biosynthesis